MAEDEYPDPAVEVGAEAGLPPDPQLEKMRRRREREPEYDDSPFRMRILPALVYPVRGANAFGFGVGAILLTLALLATMVVPLIVPLTFLVAMWFVGWLFEVLRNSTAGSPELPQVPAEFWDGLVRPTGLLLCVIVFCFWPTWAAIAFAESEQLVELLRWAGWFVMPMALLLTVLFDSPLAMRPGLIAQGIWTTLGGYVVLVAIGMVLPVFQMLVLAAAGYSAVLLVMPVMMYVTAVEMRLLGQLYHAYRHELGWVVE